MILWNNFFNASKTSAITNFSKRPKYYFKKVLLKSVLKTHSTLNILFTEFLAKTKIKFIQ